MAGAGTNTAALGFGGITIVTPLGNTESWNGTSWTELNDLNTARDRPGGAGTQTKALAFGGITTVVLGSTEEFDFSANKVLSIIP